MSHKCPACGSDQTASITIARARETRSGSFGGVGVDNHGDVGLFGGRTTQTSEFGKTLGPQALKADEGSQIIGVGSIVLGLIVGAIGLSMLGAKRASDQTLGKWALLPAAILIAFGIASFIARDRTNRSARAIAARYQAKTNAEWAKQWVCYQCGEKFVPESTASATPRMKEPARTLSRHPRSR